MRLVSIPLLGFLALLGCLGASQETSPTPTLQGQIIDPNDTGAVMQALSQGKAIHCENTISSAEYEGRVEITVKKIGSEYRFRIITETDTGVFGTLRTEQFLIFDPNADEVVSYDKISTMGIPRDCEWTRSTLPLARPATADEYVANMLGLGTEAPPSVEGPVNITSRCEVVEIPDEAFEEPENVCNPGGQA